MSDLQDFNQDGSGIGRTLSIIGWAVSFISWIGIIVYLFAVVETKQNGHSVMLQTQQDRIEDNRSRLDANDVLHGVTQEQYKQIIKELQNINQTLKERE